LKRKAIIIFLIVLIILAMYFLYKYIQTNFVEIVEDEYNEYTPEQEISDEQLRQTKVNLYFKSKETGQVEAEMQDIDARLLADDPYIQLINLLNEGPKDEKLEKLIPEDTKINNVNKEKNTLVIDVSEEFLNFGDDSSKEQIIKSITDTVTQLTEIDAIKILINGEENENFK